MSKLEDVILRDITGNRPAAGVAGRLFFDTTLVKMQRDTGAAWEDVAEVGGGGGGGVETFAVCGGRLTLETGVPVSTSDQSAKTTLYYTPYKGEQIGLNDGAGGWDIITFAEINITMVGLTASRVYDVFCWNNGGTATLEVLIWTDGTTRATGLVYEDGILVKAGDYTRRYLGTIYINSSGGETEDTITQRFVWNYYNRVPRRLFKKDATGSWTYNVDAWRQSNNAAANKFEVVCGVVEDVICVQFSQRVNSTGNTGSIGIGVNAVNDAGGDFFGICVTSAHSTNFTIVTRFIRVCPNIGYSYFASVERSNVGTTTYYGVNGMGLDGLFLA